MHIATSPSNSCSSSSRLLVTCLALYPRLSAVYWVTLATPSPGPTHLMDQQG